MIAATQKARFPLAMRVLHWSMALLLIGLLALGLYIQNIPLEAPNKWDLYPLHRAFGMLAFFLVILRLVVRLKSRVPALPDTMPWYERIGAKLAQIALYAAMLSVPLFGYIASSALPEFPGISPLQSIWFFGLELPLFPVEKNYDTTKFFITLHKWVGYGMIAVLVAHIGGALKHRFFDRPEHDVLSTMT
ncbi:cytochrome b [Coralliovum pocilloporae]|uniref:cytochrome b n=1 Tax=Coralliovum pocilloporae TaxID=3066369 RepID=UPI003306A9AB